MSWSTGILGINARNILYIKPFNKKKAIRLADNKLESKIFFHTHKIPTATVYKVIRNKKELEKFSFNEIEAKSFVIKPNRGFGGEGIKIVMNKAGLSEVEQRQLKAHISNILDGNYSLTNAPDTAILEQRIICHPDLAAFSYQGLPDIRVIVHNLIPIMAMIRFPTKASDGKANYHAGGAIAGIDLASGQIHRLVIHDKAIKILPDKNVSPIGFTIPQWDQVLHIASQAQLYSNIGYLAIDIVINKKGIPMVLEMNARGGLSIQIANKAKLRERLDRIKGLKVKTPEKGVRLGKEIFGKPSTSEQVETEIERLSGKEILGSYEPITLFSKKGKTERTVAVLDTNKIYTSIDKGIAIRLGLIDKNYEPKEKVEFFNVLLHLGQRKVRTFVTIKDYSDQTYKVAIGRRNLRKVFIDPLKGLPGTFLQPIAQVSPALEQEKEADQLLAEIYEKLSFLYYLHPTNLTEEKKKWTADPKYIPQFQYQIPSDFYDSALRELETIPHFDSDIGNLINKRAKELIQQISIVKSIGTVSFLDNCKQLFRTLSAEELALAKQYQDNYQLENTAPLNNEMFSGENIVNAFQTILGHYNIHDWKCKTSLQQLSSIRIRKNHHITIPIGKSVTQNRLVRLIAHEVLTHILCQNNGKKQNWHIFSYGFPHYIYTQEGLAVYNEIQSCPQEKDIVMHRAAQNAFMTCEADQISGPELMEKLLQKHSKNESWRRFVRLKRGMTNTELPGGLGRQSVYFLGLLAILSLKEVSPIYYCGRIHHDYTDIANKYSSYHEFPIPQFPIII